MSLPVPQPSPEDLRDIAGFEALMWALARPGLPRALPAPGPAPILTALIDGDCAIHCDDSALAAQARARGARIAPVEEADHVFAATADPALLARLRTGSDLYPDDGATLVLPAQIDTGPTLTLHGPGIDGTLTLRLGGLPDGFWNARAKALRYPMGFEIFFVGGARVLGLPRSTTVEVL